MDSLKITIDIDCTPDEARQFMGLPDVKPLQAAVLTKATPKDYRIVRGDGAGNFVEGDSGSGDYFLDSRDDRHISDSRAVHGG